MFAVSSYVNSEYNFPKREQNPKVKQQEPYCTDAAKAIYALWCRNATSWGVDATDFFSDMRAYSNGQQDASRYMSWIKNEDADTNESVPTIWDDNLFTKEAKRKGYLTSMFQNLSPASKIMNSLHGLMDKLDYDIMADTIDSDSRGMVEFMKYEQFHKAKDIAFQNDYKTKAGLPIDEPTNFPKTKEELDAFEAREGFKLNVAKAMQKLLRYSFHISGWDSVVRKKLLDDLITTGYCTSMDYFDDETGTFKVKWLDPARTVIQFSDEFDYSDSEYGGYYETITISNLRLKRPDLKEDDILRLAKGYKGRFDNPKQWKDKYTHLDPSTGSYGYDNFKICVFHAYWIDADTHKSIYWKGKGSPRIIDIGYDSKITPLTENQKSRGFVQELKQTTVRQVYQCTWVVDSDISYDYGLYHMAARPELTKPKIPIHAEQLLQPSLIYRLVPILDHIAVTWLQFQNDLANMVQRGYAINMGMLMNISMNGKELDPASVLSMWKQKGLLPYVLSPTGQYTGGMALPITPIEGGLGKRVEETMMSLQMYYKSIEDIVGINPLSLGASPDPNAPVSTSEAALRATSNVLKPIIDALFEEKESIADSICLRLQIGLRVSPDIRKAYAGVVPPTDIKAMVLAEQSGAKYGIMLKARPDEKQRGNIVRYMEIAIQAGQITPPDAMYFMERIESGADITEVRQEIAYSIQKYEEQKQIAQQQNIAAQNEGLASIEQQKSQSQAQQTVLETQGKIAEENARAMSKARLQRMEQNYKLLADTQAEANAEKGILFNTPKK